VRAATPFIIFFVLFYLLVRFLPFTGLTMVAVYAGLIVVMPYLAGPILIRFSHRQTLHPKFEPRAVDQIPKAAAKFFTETAQTMAEDGFVQWPTFVYQSKNAAVYVKFLLNRAAGDMAMIAASYGMVGGASRLHDMHVAFLTRYADDTEIQTSNTKIIGVFVPTRRRDSAQFATVGDTRQLYCVHTRRVQRLAPAVAKVLPPEGHEIESATAEIVRELQRQVDVGYFYVTGDSLRPTWKGAALMTWKLCWPVKQIRRARINRRAQAALRALVVA
jgi:hypothetical protein